jgi:hypothetical protein
MSVTVTLEHNHAWCRNHAPGKVVKRSLICDCGGSETPGVASGCVLCYGSRRLEFEVFPWEINLANANFRTLWSALGFDADEDGSLPAYSVLNALASTSEELCCRAGEDLSVPGQCRTVVFGLSLQQAQRYWVAVREIAEEGLRRGVRVVWF